MAIAWSSRNDGLNSGSGKSKDYFQEHNEAMRSIRKVLAPWLELNAAKQDNSVLLGSVSGLHISRTISETGGARCPSTPAAWLALMFMWELTPHKFSPN